MAIDIDDPGGTRSRLAAAVELAATQGADLVVLPELAWTGYVFHDADEARALAHRSRHQLETLAQWSRHLDLVIVSGWAEVDGDQGHNAAVVVDPGRLLGTYRKVHLWGEEQSVFTPGDQPPLVVDTSVGRVGVMVCYDLEFPEWVRLAAEAGADLVAAPVNWPLLPRPDGERPIEAAKAMAAAASYRVAIAIADRCGTERGVEWIGGSMVVDADGYPVVGPVTPVGQTAAPIVLMANVDLAASRNKTLGRRNHVVDDRRPDLY
ncbi:nitrilase-related carbon-nitrogen hydrolase [Aestuariimicrobium ganziense]|uniref:nitrilase-related carbon-nitrogen hydrolase n=1 Tax=Aestuariimicrobium ganziense TaxID=2773677 RepID=UPI0019444FB6|nr:nitrilase-related carbon-nitrogen hydrolase [Aestuariimicrobium ganziense]